ncbi:MAG: pyrroline-5-carboxylate reductase [Oscillospiraceae bacterium]|nr:pyrroline-5-carboxylate reductase [Oscillospiraceae bacterium]
MIKIGTIGCGNMASAILRGAAKGMPGKFAFYGCDPHPEKLAALSDIGLTPLPSAAEAARCCDYLLLAVKPQSFPAVARELKSAGERDRVYLSIMAGISADAIKEALGFDARLCMIMPNTPLMVGMGATAMAAVEPLTREEFETARAIFACAGLVREIPADRLNDVIPLNGSSPAFIYEFARGFLRYGEQAGFSAETALALFCQSLRGAAEMLEHSGMDAEELIRMVSSKGGTTLAGLTAFEEGGLQPMIDLCCRRCADRARELAEGT